MSWSANQTYINNHWGYNAEKAEKFIAGVITEFSGAAPASTWKRAQLLLAVGELLLAEPTRERAVMIWQLYDAALFIFVGEWLLEKRHTMARAQTE